MAVPEAAGVEGCEHVFTDVTEGCVAQVVAKAHGLDEVFVEVQGSGNGAAYLGDLQGVGKAGDIVIAEGGNEDLGLVLKPAEGLGVDDSVSVALEVGAEGAGLLFDLAASGEPGLDGKGREELLAFFEIDRGLGRSPSKSAVGNG